MFTPEQIDDFIEHLDSPEAKRITQLTGDCYKLIQIMRKVAGHNPIEHTEMVMVELEKAYANAMSLTRTPVDHRTAEVLTVFLHELTEEMNRYRRYIKDQHDIRDEKVSKLLSE